MYFPKRYAVGALALVLVFFVGLLIYVYFQQGVDSAIRLRGTR